MSEENELEIVNGIDENEYDDGHNEAVYIVINEGEVIYVALDEDEAKNYADNRGIEARDRALEGMGAEEATSEKDIFDAALKAGYDSGVFEVYCIDLSRYREDDVIYVDGNEIDYNDVVDLLEKEECEHEDEYYEDDYYENDNEYDEDEL